MEPGAHPTRQPGHRHAHSPPNKPKRSASELADRHERSRLVISPITFFDARAEKSEEDVKEAAQIAWWYGNDSERRPIYLQLENRSLRPIYDALLVDKQGNQTFNFYVDGVVAARSRVTYNLAGHEKEIGPLDKPTAQLLFRDALDQWWWTGYEKGLGKYREKVDITSGRESNRLAAWRILPTREVVAGCG